ARTADTTSTRTVVEGDRRCVPAFPARCWCSDRATAASRRMQTAKDRTLGATIAAPAVVDSERLSPGRDRRWHPRQVQRCRSCLPERKITLPTDLRGRGIAMERAAPFRGGQLGARNPRRLERTGYDHAEGHEAHADDEIPHHSRLLFSLVRRVPPLVRHRPGTGSNFIATRRCLTHDPRRRPRQRAADLHTRPFRSSSIMGKAKHSKPLPADAAVRMTTAEATVGALMAHGIETVYALPGVHNDPLFDALFKAGDHIRTVHTRHEQGAAYLALAPPLATGKPQVYSVVPGPGLLNSSAALLTAYGMNAPVLALI